MRLLSRRVENFTETLRPNMFCCEIETETYTEGTKREIETVRDTRETRTSIWTGTASN